MAGLVGRGEREALITEFDAVKASLGPETARALEESNRVIEAFGAILAAREDARGRGKEP